MTELRYGTPEEAGMRPERIALARERCAEWVKSGETPSLVVLAARRGVVFLHEAFGALGPEEDAPPLQRDSIFPLSSLSKPITATLAMSLVEDGLLGLNRPALDYLPELSGEGAEEILVHHLLTHTSGYHPDDQEAFVQERMKGLEVPPPPPTQHPIVNAILHIFYPMPLRNRPGEQMVYWTHNYDFLGEIVRRLSGRSIVDFARERVFAPLGMRDSYYSVPEELEPRVVKRAKDLPMAAAENPLMQGIDSRQMQETPYAGGGVFSTARDVAAFGQTFLNGGRYGEERILSRPAVQAMTRDQIPGVPAEFMGRKFSAASWGYGWAVESNEPWKYHSSSLLRPGSAFDHGGGGGARLWVDPWNDIVGVYLSVVTELAADEGQIMNADRFINVVTSAAEG